MTGDLPLTVHVPAAEWAYCQRRLTWLETLLLRIVRDRRRMQEWYDAAEMAALRLPGLPLSRAGISQKAAREGWPRQKRAARRIAYHVSALPARAFDALIARMLDLPPLDPDPADLFDLPAVPAPELPLPPNAAPAWVLPLMRILRGEAQGDLSRAWRALPAHLPPGTVLPDAKEAAELARTHNVEHVPKTRWGMSKWLERDLREDQSGASGRSRVRDGQKGGGGMEHYWCFFPKPLWDVLDREAALRQKSSPWCPPPMTRRTATRGQWTAGWPERPTVDLSPPSRWLAEDLAVIAELDTVPRFTPYVIRRCRRCRVRIGNKFYFNLGLDPFHEEDVCITFAEGAPHLAFVFKFDRPRRQARWVYSPGDFICIADDRLGKTRYISLEFERAALALRAAGVARRAAQREQDQLILRRDLRTDETRVFDPEAKRTIS